MSDKATHRVNNNYFNQIKNMMKTKERKVYLVPQCQIAQVSELTNLMSTSFPSQHNPGHHASGPSSAKAVAEWEDLEESSKGTYSPWED